MKDWQKKLIENPSKYVLSWVTREEWEHIVLNELFEPGKGNFNKGHTGFRHTTASKLKLSKSHMGITHTEETKKKISISGKGAVRSEAFKENLTTIVKGRTHVTNGIINKFVFPDNIPDGFKRGRIVKRKKP